MISFAVLKWEDCLSVQVPFELPVQLLLVLKANWLDQIVNEVEFDRMKMKQLLITPINKLHTNSALIFKILTKSHTCVGQLCVDFLPIKIKVGYNKSRLPFFVVRRAISINSFWLCSNLQRCQSETKALANWLLSS